MITRQAVGLLWLAVMSAGAMPLGAQRSVRSCTPPDTLTEWFRSQRAWLSDSKHDWSDEQFRNSLVSAAGLIAAPLAVQIGVQRDEPAAGSTDTAVLAQLRTLAATRGSAWPTRSVVGAAGVRAVWLLAQRDTALERAALHRMMESGPDEALPADVAVLEDRVRLLSGRKQLYGSQLHMVNGKLVSAAIEDPAHVDMRRDAASLPPLEQAICTIR